MLFVAALPLMAAALIAIVEIGRIAVARARLSAAADRAAYAGAASLAHSLNMLAASNRRINESFRRLKADFDASSQQDEDAARQRIARYEAERDSELGEMASVLDAMRARSAGAAAGALAANYPSAFAWHRIAGEVRLRDDLAPEEQWERVGYSHIEGDIYLDPEDVEGGEYDALKYLVKERGGDAAIGVFASARVEPLTAGPILSEGIDIYASAAASAYGGSIEDFAIEEVEDSDLAEGWTDEEGYDALYRAALVPKWTIGVEEAED